MILTRLAAMEDMMSKFANIFSQIQILTPSEPKPTAVVEKSQAFDDSEVNAFVAHEYVAEKLAAAESEHDDSQHSQLVVDVEYLESTENSQEEFSRTPKESEAALTFPLTTVLSLNAVENAMLTCPRYSERLKKHLIELKRVLGSETSFNDLVERIIDRKLLYEFNWHGCKGKKELRAYQFFNQLLKEVYEKFLYDNSPGNFEKEMVQAIATSHRRNNNQLYRKRKKTGHEREENFY